MKSSKKNVKLSVKLDIQDRTSHCQVGGRSLVRSIDHDKECGSRDGWAGGVGLFCGLMRSGATAVPTQTPPMLEGMKGGYWKINLLLLGRQLRDSNVTVKC